MAPCSAFSKQRHTFQDHFMKNADPTTKTTNAAGKRKIFLNQENKM